MFTNFSFDLEGAFAFELNIKNEIRGIGLEQFDFASEFGSNGRLQSFLAMNQLSEFPDDPDAAFFGTNSTVNIIGQEAGHRWLAYVRFRDTNGQNSTSFLVETMPTGGSSSIRKLPSWKAIKSRI